MVFGKQSSAILIHERHFGESGRNPGQFQCPSLHEVGLPSDPSDPQSQLESLVILGL